MRIAIVGGGIAGLVAAHLLHQDHDITLFEAHAVVGGHAHTVHVQLDAGDWAVDTGFIVFNQPNYPKFTQLLGKLGVATQPSCMSFSVRADAAGLEYNGSSLNRLFGQRRNLLRPAFYRMVGDIVRFNRAAPRAVQDGAAGASLAEYLGGERYSRPFVDHYLVPLAASLWSQPCNRTLQMPLRFLVGYLQNHGMLSEQTRPEWRAIRGGSERYVEALIRPFRERTRTRHLVRAITRHADCVLVDGEQFDEVIIASHADQALRMLGDPRPAEREILGAFPYQANTVVLHTDSSLLPRRRALWGAWNYHVSQDPDAPVAITYDMNILQTLAAPTTFCVTLNRTTDIAPDRILWRTIYHHPVFTEAGVRAQARHAEISGRNRTHYCGAYWGHGFHEDGVSSALAVCRHFGATL